MDEQFFHVIMPVGSDSRVLQKQRLIAALASIHGIHVHFPQYSKHEPSFDLDATIVDMRRSMFVIADLSLERPSCYYELGIAEVLGKRVSLVAESGTEIHQTVSRSVVRFYNDDSQLASLIDSIVQDEIMRKYGT